jgi:colanic acid biosynthesis glycosyl transferase WcaI
MNCRISAVRILLYGINFAPELIGIGKYAGEMAARLVAGGHEVRVITAPPYYPEWKVWPSYSAGQYSEETMQGVRVLRTPLWVPQKVSARTRLIHLASFALSSLPTLFMHLRWKPQVVFVVAPAFFCAPAAAAFASLSGAKAWLHVQDFEIDAAFDMGLLQGALLRRWVTVAEGWLLRRFDTVSTISGRMLALAAAKGVDPARLVSFPNWVDIRSIQPLAGPGAYRAELGIAPGAVVVLYSGNMGSKQGLEVLADVARLLREEAGLVFVLCGNGAGKADLMNACQGLANVLFLDLQPLERLSELLGLADMHLLPQRADAADLVMPSKLTGMLASGRAVIATAAPGTELAMVVEEKAQCGVVVPPEDAGALAGALLALAHDPERRAVMGANGRAYAERELDKETVLLRFEQDLMACVAQK